MIEKKTEKKARRILVINMGSTSTKVGVFDDYDEIASLVVRHDKEELNRLTLPNGDIMPQKELRTSAIMRLLAESDIPLGTIDIISARSGRFPPMRCGTYEINDKFIADAPRPVLGAPTLCPMIAKELADRLGIPCYTVDPTNSDDLCAEARMSGIPGFDRRTLQHTLNQRACARRCCAELGVDYENTRLIVAHLGGGFSIGAHISGKIVECNNASEGEGPFSPERAGSVPLLPLLDMCFDGRHTYHEIYRMFNKTGGLYAHLKTSSLPEVERMIDAGDEQAKSVYRAMIYKIAKEIGGCYGIMSGRVDALILTGGLVYSERFTTDVLEYVGGFARTFVYPGEMEMEALAQGVLRVLDGKEKMMVY